MTSLYLNSPNISAARAYICQGDAYLVGLNVLNGVGNTNSAVKDPPTSIAYIAGNCSDGTKLPDFSYDFFNPNWSTCSSLNYSSQYNYSSQLYTNQDAAHNLSSLAERFTYRQAFRNCAPCQLNTHSPLRNSFAQAISLISHDPSSTSCQKILGSSKQACPKRLSIVACCPGSKLLGDLFSWSFAILPRFKHTGVKARVCAEATGSSGSSMGKGPTMEA